MQVQGQEERGCTRARHPRCMQAQGGLKVRNKLAHVNDWKDIPPSRKLTTHTASTPSAILLAELNLLPLKVDWWRQSPKFYNRLARAPHGSFHKTILLDNLQDSERFRVRNFSRSVSICLLVATHI